MLMMNNLTGFGGGGLCIPPSSSASLSFWLRGRGTPLSQPTTDETGKALAWNNAQISSATKLAYDTSLGFQGETAGSRIVATSSGSAFALPGAFTLRVLFNLFESATTGEKHLFRVETTDGFGLRWSGSTLALVRVGIGDIVGATYAPTLGVWNEVIVNRDASNNVTMFINRSNVATATSSFSFVDGNLTVGGITTLTAGSIGGYMQDPMVYKAVALGPNDFPDYYTPFC